MTCDTAREMIPLYAAGSLSEDDGAELIAHVVGCEVCQGDLVETMRLAREVRRAFAQVPGPARGTWISVAARTLGTPVLRVELGSELAGLSLDVGATKTGLPIRGSLSILGREVPVLRI
ncbi:MAG: hypothetical protein BIP78_1439 [Candidatus Bipolaricaulis sibiricus]|uniref:Putative zinc-finger domain-containing protein n=1 Tax=Bipolaricaulis sibiricus TaxID=2501609 RepID=A0A410FVR9_BIPS1|nr:MAG: hypothetical protein BIP78_1439 [Candidatus Bipolaricaulis sibiricus]